MSSTPSATDAPASAPREATVAATRALPNWFYAALAFGAVVRLFLLSATPGTLDVEVWQLHTMALGKKGLIDYYQGGALQFNHPPPVAIAMSGVAGFAKATGLSFAACLRFPFVLFDLATVVLLLRWLQGSRHREWVAAAFWLHPLAVIYSAYHGNTDSAVATFAVAGAMFASRGNGALAGAMLGLGVWIKLPVVLAGPALLLALPDKRETLRFCAVGGVVAIAGFAPALIMDARAVVDAVILYPGLEIRTGSGITIWGLLNLLPDMESLSTSMRLSLIDLRAFVMQWNSAIAIGPVLLLAWLRRGDVPANAATLGTTLAAGFALFYGFTNSWAFQYFAWSIPFWLLAPRWFALGASLFASAYIYGLYAWLCGDPFLLGSWDFIGKPDWPGALLAARNAANAFFALSGIVFLVSAIRGSRAQQQNAG
ncbi:MAG: hypothetical protein QF570_02545 [Myxococcota bacterium]|nr:hypothetical protein [Myxococcota bacterium]